MSELRFQIALTLIPGIGDVLGKNLLSYCGSSEVVFKTKKTQLVKIPGIDVKRADAIIHFNDWKKIDDEISFIEKNKIQPLFFTDENYPQRLKNCNDSPLLLYYKGNANLNVEKIISIVGTRKATENGKQICEELITGLSKYPVLIVSGLAFGIDITAHKAAMKNNLNTVAVLGHGLNTIYPFEHKAIANKMINMGGLLTEFISKSKMVKENFPKRNRIVAGMADAVVVIETGIKGGALITAKIAYTYNKDVFAIPGRVKDAHSQGCNYLIKNNQAVLIESAEDIFNLMNWDEKQAFPKKQKELFIELSKEEKLITDLFQNGEAIEIDTILFKTKLSNSQAANNLLNLEFKGVIRSLPGKRYQLI